ncbi:MAG: hypothetical protein ACM3ZC_14700 [Bacteroidota bacterium]
MLSNGPSKRNILAGIFLSCLISIGLGLHPAGPLGPARAAEKNPAQMDENNGEDPWLAHMRACAEEDQLYRYAVKLFGVPVNCEGKITDTFDDMKFGIIRFTFAGGNELELETYPPEAFRAVLRVPRGFPNEREAREVLAQYIEQIGPRIDWSKPGEETARDGTRVLNYEDPEINAAATMVYRNAALVEIGFHMAL